MSAARELLRRMLHSVADSGASIRGSFADESLQKLCRELVSERGEASGTAIAREIAERYLALPESGRLSFFEQLLNKQWLADPEEVLRLATAYHQQPGPAELNQLFRTVEPKRQELFRRINTGPHGIETIVRMRQDVLSLLPAHANLEPVNADLIHLLSSWFNRGFLELRRIDWRTPPVILEKLMQYEAVHPIEGWPDLRRRLQGDRRCFAFFHPALPDEPLIFVQVALTRGVATAIQPLLAIDGPATDLSLVDTATFYSISNSQDGLRNISFGAFLLKQVIHELSQEEIAVRRFVTLSPIPGFRAWLAKQAPSLVPDEIGPETSKDQQRVFTQWCARYLSTTGPNRRAIDPVAHFHLSNGASIEQIHWMADTSPKGIRQSLGFMVNYRYRPLRIVRNHELYAKQGRIAVSSAVQALLDAKRAK
ncbi:MAG: malonyl-CoA decarboxylase [Acidobacteriota bacterium]